MLSNTKENYLKALVQLTVFNAEKVEVSTKELALHLGVKSASISDMIQKLKEKGLVNFKKYGKISLTDLGQFEGVMVIRRHRLWETFLSEKLNFSWDEVHDVAEELEHIHSQKLIDKLDEFLGFPEFDPHGDAIPTSKGKVAMPHTLLLGSQKVGTVCKIVAVKDNSVDFLQYVDHLDLKINDVIEIVDMEEFDSLMTVTYKGKSHVVSPKFTENIYIVIEET